MPTRRQRLVGGESGSAIVAALVITFVLALLGFALFDLAVVESRLVLGSEADGKAFEVAQVGLDHALYMLQQDLCGGSPTCQTSPPASSWGWMDGTINGTAWGPSGTPYNGTSGNFDNPPIISQQMQNGGSSGSYTVQFLSVKKTGATALSVPCTVPTGSTLCADVILVRSTGTATVGSATVSRTVQAVAQGAYKLNPGAGGGVSAGGASGAPITGNAQIAGSLHILTCPGGCPTAAMQFGGGASVVNNYSSMPALLRNLVPRLPLACPPANPGCDVATQGVETLHATVRVAVPSGSPGGPHPITLSGASSLGQFSAGTNPDTGRVGKATLDGVFLGAGCNPGASPVCSDVVGGGKPGLQQVYSDNLIRGYDILPVPSFPKISDAFTLNDNTYTHYADCSAGGSCNAITPDDFFISHAFKITPTTMVDVVGQNCTVPGGPKPPRFGPCNLYNILTGGAAGAGPTPQKLEWWDDKTPSFTKTFTCGVDANCNDAAGKRINGDFNGSKPSQFKLSWDQPSKVLRIQYNSGGGFQDLVGALSSDTVLPILIYVDGRIMVCQTCKNTNLFFVGQAAFLAKGDTDRGCVGCPNGAVTNGDIGIDSGLLACPGICGTDHQAFPQKNLLMFLTPGKIYMATCNGCSNVSIMGLFYAGDSASPAWMTKKQTNVAGWIIAPTFDTTLAIPQFFEVVAALPSTTIPMVPLPTAGVGGGGGGSAWWHVKTARWLECRGALPSGPCQ